MNNHLKGFVISALLHAGLLSWALAINTQPEIKPEAKSIALSVSMFQEEVVIPPPAPVVKTPEPIVKEVAPTTPMEPEFADLPVAKIEPPKPVEPKHIPAPIPPPIKVVEVESEIIPEPEVIKPVPEIVKPEPKKAIKPKVVKKKLAKKKPEIKKPPIKKVVKRKVVKKKVVRKKVKKKVPRKVVKIVKKIPKKAIVKPQRRPQAIKRPVKRVVVQRRYKKVGGVPSNKKHSNQQSRHAKKVVAARPKAIAKPRVARSAAASAQNTNLKRQYKARLQQFITSKKRYPKRAKRRGQQGKVTVSFHITHNGVISNIRIVNSAGNKSLDAATIAAIKKASGRIPYPKNMQKKSLSLTVTLSYILS